jgi:hypothetical protein
VEPTPEEAPIIIAIISLATSSMSICPAWIVINDIRTDIFIYINGYSLKKDMEYNKR